MKVVRNLWSAASPALTLCAVLFALGFPAQAQQTKQNPRIGYLDASTASASAVLVGEFRKELSKLGWNEGKNITIEYRFAEQNNERLTALAVELVRLNVDVIVAASTASAAAAKSATSTIPIVMTIAGNPVASGLVGSLARPGGNVTGNSTLVTELNTKRLEILKDVIPRLIRVALLRDPRTNTEPELQLKELRVAAQALKIKLEEQTDTEADAKGLESAFKSAKRKQVDAIMIMPARPFFTERKQIVELAARHRMPVIYPQKEYIDAGGLMFYGADYADLNRRAAGYVDRILKGAKPADLPVEQPKKFELIINLKSAKQIGLIIPPNVLARADRVIR